MSNIEADVYTFGGCSSCGTSLPGWLSKQGVKVNIKNTQIPYVKREARDRATALGVTDFKLPATFINGNVVIGFDRDKLSQLISEVQQ